MSISWLGVPLVRRHSRLQRRLTAVRGLTYKTPGLAPWGLRRDAMSQLQLDGLSRLTASEDLNDSMTTRRGFPGHAARPSPVGVSALPLATRSRPLAETMLPVLAAEYVCPGETHPISHSIHLARLSSFYSKCRECEHRHEVGHFSVQSVEAAGHPVEPTGAKVHHAVRTSLLETDGVRAIYLNELDRPRAAEWGAALALMLWDDEPRLGGTRRQGDKETRRQGDRQDDSDNDAHASLSSSPRPLVALSLSPSVPESPLRSARRGPVVVIGFDERPASPDIVTGVALGLRRMGCQVIDLGQTTAACFQFAVQHLDAAAGMFVTGAGCDPAWTGFDLVGRGARPWSTGHKLEELETRARAGVMRPTRTAGSQRTFQALVPYEAGLWKHFHALRPLHVVCGSATKLLPRIFDRLFARLPCRVTHVTLPVRRRDLCDEQDGDVRRVATAVVSGGQHLGLIVDDDGQRCAFVTERGRLVSSGELARVLIDIERHEHHSLKVVATAPLASELTPWLMRLGVEAAISEESAASVTTVLAESGARLGLLGDGRVWFGETPPACDAIVTLARVLQALSQSDASCGDVVSRLSRS
jgi:phosphomannomutase